MWGVKPPTGSLQLCLHRFQQFPITSFRGGWGDECPRQKKAQPDAERWRRKDRNQLQGAGQVVVGEERAWGRRQCVRQRHEMDLYMASRSRGQNGRQGSAASGIQSIRTVNICHLPPHPSHARGMWLRLRARRGVERRSERSGSCWKAPWVPTGSQ